MKLARLAFPFRRLAIWLSLLVLAVAALALGVSALLVLPSLHDSLVADRLASVTRAATRLVGQGHTNITVEVAAIEAVGPLKVGVLEPIGGGQFRLLTGSLTGTPNDPLALRSLNRAIAGGPHSLAPQIGVVDLPSRYAAESAVPVQIGQPPNTRPAELVIAAPLNDVNRTVATVRHQILLATVIALPVAWIAGLLAAFALATRIRRLERAARRVAAGDLVTTVSDDGKDEIAELAHAFDHMRRRLERTDHARREFVTVASHELRTPLFALGGFLELLEEEDDPLAKREYLQTMRAQVGRLTRLASDLLDLSRLDAGGVALASEPVDLGGVVQMLVEDFAATAEQRGLRIVAEGCDEILAHADANRVAQIGRALVDNALKHNPAGTTISVAASRDHTTVVLTVSDDGPPIAAAARERLFDRFYRGPGAGEGSGLGLAIARELAQRMGGELRVHHQNAAAGKDFQLVLPPAVGQPRPVGVA